MFDVQTITEAASRRGFKRKNERNWTRRTDEFVQLVNLQKSAWSDSQAYLNFAMWPLALGEPSSFAESKMMFRTRAENLGATDPDTLFDAADRLQSLQDLRSAIAAGSVSALISVELRRLLDA
ncbi:DUF4304 domain-containing protein [Sphingomonas qomolangmaensis]|uniref:DUF4304 domain-containing protein n=1 Tax=Sphingomonas qomolangmaensis TaxID=2918765 RepID=A0ABY5L7U3_9SPHN|nr:DUF4304 domain-containing protein [Sphingomonas qomolangmaensis]UUL81663.1 DUF4304 domain-containing protein [Sphingomonas qomolangmaensis]